MKSYYGLKEVKRFHTRKQLHKNKINENAVKLNSLLHRKLEESMEEIGEGDISAVVLEKVNCDDSQFLGARISIGAPPQEFLVAIDTTSPDLWVASFSCDETCGSQEELYDQDASQTVSKFDEEADDAFFEGDLVNGMYVADVLRIGVLEMPERVFVAARTFKDDFALCEEVSGVMGINKLVDAQPDEPFTLHSFEGFMRSPIVSMYQNKEYDVNGENPDENVPAELVLGGVNMMYYENCLKWYGPLVFDDEAEAEDIDDSVTDFWSFYAENVFIGDQDLDTGFAAIIDSMARHIVGPIETVRKYALENELTCYSAEIDEEVDCKENYFDLLTVDCTDREEGSFAPLVFIVNGDPYEFSLFDLSIIKDEDEKVTCVLRLTGDDLKFWVMGTPFLEKYYTAFNIDTGEVGFAPSTRLRSTECEDDQPIDVALSLELPSDISDESDEEVEEEEGEGELGEFVEDDNEEDDGSKFLDSEDSGDDFVVEDFEDDPIEVPEDDAFDGERDDGALEVIDDGVNEDDEGAVDDFDEGEDDEDEIEEYEGDADEYDADDYDEENDLSVDLDIGDTEGVVLRNIEPVNGEGGDEDPAAISMGTSPGRRFFNSPGVQMEALIATIVSGLIVFLIVVVRRRKKAAKERQQFLKFELGDMSISDETDRDIELFRMDHDLELS